MKNGIDVSEWQGSVDWSKVNADFAILRAGYGRLATQKDKRFDEYYKGAKAAGIPVGAYWYSYAMSEDEARQEAKACLEVLKGKQFEYPIYFDLEEKKQFELGREKVSAIIDAFLGELEKADYFCGLYMSAYYLTAYTTEYIKARYCVWVAHYDVSKPDYSSPYGMWQKSSRGNISGISGDVDIDECYEDYPARIKAAGDNGFPKQAAKVQKQVTITIDDHTYSGLLTEM